MPAEFVIGEGLSASDQTAWVRPDDTCRAPVARMADHALAAPQLLEFPRQLRLRLRFLRRTRPGSARRAVQRRGAGEAGKGRSLLTGSRQTSSMARTSSIVSSSESSAPLPADPAPGACNGASAEPLTGKWNGSPPPSDAWPPPPRSPIANSMQRSRVEYRVWSDAQRQWAPAGPVGRIAAPPRAAGGGCNDASAWLLDRTIRSCPCSGWCGDVEPGRASARHTNATQEARIRPPGRGCSPPPPGAQQSKAACGRYHEAGSYGGKKKKKVDMSL